MIDRLDSIQSVLPPGVLSVLNGDDQLGPLITAHPKIKKVNRISILTINRSVTMTGHLADKCVLTEQIAFTGSIQTGKKVMESASLNLKRVTLELGMLETTSTMERL